MTTEKTLNAADLRHFSGSEVLYRHALSGGKYTEGVQYVAETGGAYWLIDAIFSWQTKPKVRQESFQGWVLKVKDGVGRLKATDGHDAVLVRQNIPYTDFPLPEIRFFLCDGVLMLPSEY